MPLLPCVVLHSIYFYIVKLLKILVESPTCLGYLGHPIMFNLFTGFSTFMRKFSDGVIRNEVIFKINMTAVDMTK